MALGCCDTIIRGRIHTPNPKRGVEPLSDCMTHCIEMRDEGGTDSNSIHLHTILIPAVSEDAEVGSGGGCGHGGPKRNCDCDSLSSSLDLQALLWLQSCSTSFDSAGLRKCLLGRVSTASASIPRRWPSDICLPIMSAAPSVEYLGNLGRPCHLASCSPATRLRMLMLRAGQCSAYRTCPLAVF